MHGAGHKAVLEQNSHSSAHCVMERMFHSLELSDEALSGFLESLNVQNEYDKRRELFLNLWTPEKTPAAKRPALPRFLSTREELKMF